MLNFSNKLHSSNWRTISGTKKGIISLTIFRAKEDLSMIQTVRERKLRIKLSLKSFEYEIIPWMSVELYSKFYSASTKANNSWMLRKEFSTYSETFFRAREANIKEKVRLCFFWGLKTIFLNSEINCFSGSSPMGNLLSIFPLQDILKT